MSEMNLLHKRAFTAGSSALGSKACDLLLGEQLCDKSDSIKWIDAAFSHERKCRDKDHKKFEELHNNNPQSSDMFESNLTDTYYPHQPKDLEQVCLNNFVREYDKCE